jgi:hypothetical protein
MTVKPHLAELERQHKVLEHEIAEVLGKSPIDDFEDRRVKASKIDLEG